MPSNAEIRKQIAWELNRRQRLSVPAFAGGFLYLLSAIVITSTLNGLPTVGPLQGLAPVIAGETNPLVSPRTDEVKFISHHAFTLIAGSVLAAIAVIALTLILLLLFDAAAFRRPTIWRPARIARAGGRHRRRAGEHRARGRLRDRDAQLRRRPRLHTRPPSTTRSPRAPPTRSSPTCRCWPGWRSWWG